MKRIYLLMSFVSALWFNAQTTYCTPSFPQGCSGDQINSFSIPAANFSHMDTGCSTDAYGDFTSMVITLQAGVTYSFSINPVFSSQNVKIWVDLNNDGTFDESTETVAGGPTGSANTFSGTILIPATTAVGTHRMRVANRWGTDPTPCNISGYGEAHDYTLSVTSPPSCLSPSSIISSNVASSSATVSWTAPSTAPANGYDIYYTTTNTVPTSTTTPNASGITTTSYNLTNLQSGTNYYVWVRSSCSTTDQSAWLQATFLTPPANDDCSGAIALTAGATFSQNALTGTNIGATEGASSPSVCTGYLDVWYSVTVPASGNITVETQSVSGSSFTDSVLSLFTGSCGSFTEVGCNDDNPLVGGTFSIVTATGLTPGSTVYAQVRNFYGSAEAAGSFQVSAYDASLATTETRVKNIESVYPNPFTDILNISDVRNVKSITITDTSGRLVKSILKRNSQLNLNDVKPGLYLVTLQYLDGTTKTIKSIKK